MTGLGTEAIIALIREHGVLAVMAGALIEEIFVPIPSPVVPMAAGFVLVETRQLIPALVQILLLITIPASLTSAISSYFVYGIAYKGGEPIIRRYGRYLDVKWKNVEKLERHFNSDREKYYVALFRAIPIVPLSLVSGAAGLFQMDWKEYGIWSFIGMLPRNFFLALLGWYFREDFLSLASKIDSASTVVMITVAGSVLLWILYKNINKFRDRYIFGED